MAYANYRYKGHNFIGEVHGEHLIPLAGLTDVGPETSAELLASAARLTESRVALSETTLRAASPRAGKILCVGLNYKGHAGEACTAAFPSSSPSTHPPSPDPATTSSCLRNPPRSTLRANSPSSSARQVAASPNRTPWTTSLAIASPTTSPCATSRTSPTNGCRARSGTTPHRLAPHRHPCRSRHQKGRHQHNPERGSGCHAMVSMPAVAPSGMRPARTENALALGRRRGRSTT